MSIFSYKVVLGPYTASPVAVSLIKAFQEVHGLKMGKCIPWFSLNCGCIIKSLLLISLGFGEREKLSGAKCCVGRQWSFSWRPWHMLPQFICSSLSKLGTDLAEIWCVFRLSVKILWTYPAGIHSVLETSQIVIPLGKWFPVFQMMMPSSVQEVVRMSILGLLDAADESTKIFWNVGSYSSNSVFRHHIYTHRWQDNT
jgi:hypothetical protein